MIVVKTVTIDISCKKENKMFREFIRSLNLSHFISLVYKNETFKIKPANLLQGGII